MKVERWLSPDALGAVEYSGYWNEPANETAKAFDIRNGDFTRMERYLDSVGLRADLQRCLAELARDGRSLTGQGIDLAAGTLWAVPHLLRADVDRLYCVELSEHRLLTYGPRVLEHYRVDPARIVLAHGSFYDLKIESGTLDFAFMSQALHHADDASRLLSEVRRVLRPGGSVIIIGEHMVHLANRARYAAKAVLSAIAPRSRVVRGFEQPANLRRVFRLRGADLQRPDPVLGDHLYTHRDYREMFAAAGFAERRVQRRGAPYVGYVLRAV